MINRKQRNIIWENSIRNKVKEDLIISLFDVSKDKKTSTDNMGNVTPFISKNLVSRLVKSLPSFGGTLSVTSVQNKEKGLSSTELRQVLSSHPSTLGFVVHSKNEELFISSAEAEQLLKEIPESPNYEVQSMAVKKELLLNLVCVLSWREVELVSEIID